MPDLTAATEDNVNGYLTAMQSYVTFRGRASRAEFWQFTVIMGVIVFAALVIDAGFISGPNTKEAPFAAIVILAHALPTIAVSVRRLHDVDRSGWFLFINGIPLVGFVLLLVWACEAGTPGPNQFGPNPIGAAVPVGGLLVARTGTVPAMPQPNRDVVGELERLATLHNQGRLSDSEFATLKARALNAGDAA